MRGPGKRALEGLYVVIGLLVVAAVVALMLDGHTDGNAHAWIVGGELWFLLGVLVGVVAAALVVTVRLRPGRYRVVLSSSPNDYGNGAAIEVGFARPFGAVTACARVLVAGEDFDDRLHAAVSEAKAKAIATQIAGG